MPSPITRLIALDSIPSTNTYMAEVADSLPHGSVVITHDQSAGRGQRGNKWESAPGANLTFSLLVRPDALPAAEQFRLSEAVSVAIAETVQRHLPDTPIRIKWPNDIYAGDRKICGILIENSIMGTNIRRSIVGIGLNVNQRAFISDAPNPVSMTQLSGTVHDLPSLLQELVAAILSRLNTSAASLHDLYMSTLWRPDRLTYRDTATGHTYAAAIHDIAPSGHITLRTLDTPSPTLLTYAFKEVAVILP